MVVSSTPFESSSNVNMALSGLRGDTALSGGEDAEGVLPAKRAYISSSELPRLTFCGGKSAPEGGRDGGISLAASWCSEVDSSLQRRCQFKGLLPVGFLNAVLTYVLASDCKIPTGAGAWGIEATAPPGLWKPSGRRVPGAGPGAGPAGVTILTAVFLSFRLPGFVAGLTAKLLRASWKTLASCGGLTFSGLRTGPALPRIGPPCK